MVTFWKVLICKITGLFVNEIVGLFVSRNVEQFPVQIFATMITERNSFSDTIFNSFRQIYRIFWKLRDLDITGSTLFWRQVASEYKILQCSPYVPQIINPRQWILTWRQQRGTATAFLCWTSIQSSWRNTEIAGRFFSWPCGSLTFLLLSSHLIGEQRDSR